MSAGFADPNWSELRHAFGTCIDIPGAVEDLCSSEKDTRRAAYWKIDNHVVVQGSLSEAAPYVCRALIEALERTTADREEIYGLLAEFAWGADAGAVTVVCDECSVPVEKATKDCLATGKDRYLTDLPTGSAIVRRHIYDLFLGIAGEVRLLRADLEPALELETDEKYREILQELMEVTEREPDELGPGG